MSTPLNSIQSASVTYLPKKANPRISFQEITSLRIHLQNGERRELTSPVIGREYFAGFLEDGLSWIVVRSTCVVGLDFTQAADPSPFVSFTRLTATEILAQRPLPQSGSITALSHGYRNRKVWVRGVARGLVLLSEATFDAVPFLAIDWIILDPAIS